MADKAELEAIEQIANAIAQAWRSGIAIDAAKLPQLQHQASAYAVQRRLAGLLDWTSQAHARRLWKVGGPNTQCTPTAACLPESLTHSSGVNMPASLPGLIGVEPEVAFRIATVDLASGKAEVQVDACCVSIEVVASRFIDPEQLDASLKLADQQMNAALVLGPWCSVPAKPWPSISCTATVNGAAIADSADGHPCGDPLWALNWLADHAQRFGLPLRGGDVVTTGSWLGMLPISQPGLFEARFDGVGRAGIQFT